MREPREVKPRSAMEMNDMASSVSSTPRQDGEQHLAYPPSELSACLYGFFRHVIRLVLVAFGRANSTITSNKISFKQMGQWCCEICIFPVHMRNYNYSPVPNPENN